MIDKLITRYSENLEALREFVELISPFLQERELENLRRNADELGPIFLGIARLDPELLGDAKIAELVGAAEDRGYAIEIEENADGSRSARFRLPASQRKNFQIALRSWSRSLRQSDLLYRSSLISLISTAESFLSDLLHFYFERFPDAAGARDNVFSLDDLRALGSIEDAKQFLIDSKVEGILRGSFTDWIDFLKSKVKLSMGYLDSRLDRMMEVYQRRNLLVHNGGYINSIYLSKTAPELTEGMEVGRPIGVPSDYLAEAINEFETVFTLVAAELWKKVEPGAPERATVLINSSFIHLQQQRWKVAEGLSFFLMQDRKIPERDRVFAQLNYWQALKWSERFNEIETEVNEADFSAKEDLLQLARLALLDQHDAFFKLLPNLLQTKKLGTEELTTWPIFRGLKDDDRLSQALLQIGNESENAVSQIGGGSDTPSGSINGDT